MYRRCYCRRMNPCKKKELEDKCSNVQNVIKQNDMCDCGFDDDESVFPENPVLGQSYVPWQTMDETFKPEIGLKKGTIFPELVNPYYPCQSMEEKAYLEASNKIGEGCNKCQMN